MTNPRPDPDHCRNGHDLRVCGYIIEIDKRRGVERKRCKACNRQRRRSNGLRRKSATGGPLRVTSPGAQSAGDG